MQLDNCLAKRDFVDGADQKSFGIYFTPDNTNTWGKVSQKFQSLTDSDIWIFKLHTAIPNIRYGTIRIIIPIKAKGAGIRNHDLDTLITRSTIKG